MKRKELLLVFIALALGAAGYCIWKYSMPGISPHRPGLQGSEETLKIDIYFASEDGNLAPEPRTIYKTAEQSDQIIQTLYELMKGPQKAGLFPTIPQGTRLRGTYMDEDQTLYIDWSRELVANHPGGSTGELATVYSVVNTLTSNFPDVKRVKFLVEGEEAETISGHIDLTQPFEADPSMNKAR